jgi:glutamate synthase (NADPH/NADH) small chain
MSREIRRPRGRTSSDLELPPGRIEEGFADQKPLYTRGEAMAEAHRCLYCFDAPCIKACPTAIDVPSFIRKIATQNVRGAARTILSANLLGWSCARVCPVEVLCAGACVYTQWGRQPIRIGRLQRFAVETALEAEAAEAPDRAPSTDATPKSEATPKPDATTKPSTAPEPNATPKKERRLLPTRPATSRRIALVGAGPASLAAAGWLALDGHSCTIYERKTIPGGLNTLGIAPYKMKAAEALREVDWLLGLGDIRLQVGVEVVEKVTEARQVAASGLLATHDAVFLGLGLGGDLRLKIPGEDGEGVIGATTMIARVKADPSFRLAGVRRAVVIGGGNTALDVLHELSLLGIGTAVVYRRSEAEMPGYSHELSAARLHGGHLVEDRAPVEIVRTSGNVSGIRIVRTVGGKPVAGEAPELVACDLVVVAIGHSKGTHVALAFPGVELDPNGRVVVDPATHRTGHPRVWAGGDCVNGGLEVVNAAAEAKVAARDISAMLADPSAVPAGG